MCWLKDLDKIHKKLTFGSNILLEFEKDKLPLCDLGYAKFFRNQEIFKSITTQVK